MLGGRHREARKFNYDSVAACVLHAGIVNGRVNCGRWRHCASMPPQGASGASLHIPHDDSHSTFATVVSTCEVHQCSEISRLDSPRHYQASCCALFAVVHDWADRMCELEVWPCADRRAAAKLPKPCVACVSKSKWSSTEMFDNDNESAKLKLEIKCRIFSIPECRLEIRPVVWCNAMINFLLIAASKMGSQVPVNQVYLVIRLQTSSRLAKP